MKDFGNIILSLLILVAAAFSGEAVTTGNNNESGHRKLVDEKLVPLNNCPADGSLTSTLIIGFNSDCDVTCAVEVMQTANIDETKYNHLKSSNMITWNVVSDAELALLRKDGKNISFIECDGVVTIEDDGTSINSELCPLKQPDFNAPWPSCDAAALTQDCKYSPMPCQLDPNETCYMTLCTCMANELVCAVASSGGNDNEGPGVVGDNGAESLISIDLCDDGMMTMPLLISFFVDTCDKACQLQTMKAADIDESKFNQTDLGIVMLNEVTDEQLLNLRGENNKSISSIECNTEMSIDKTTSTASSTKTPYVFVIVSILGYCIFERIFV